MDNADLLEQLADIHLPPEISFWPLAPGWWVLAVLVLVALIWSTLYSLQKMKQRKICAYALNELDTIHHEYLDSTRRSDEAENAARLLFVNEFNAVIRRVALWHYPNSGIASLAGPPWVDFIREKGNSSGLTEEISDLITRGRFMPYCEVDINQLYQFGQQWISSLYETSAESADPPKLNA